MQDHTGRAGAGQRATRTGETKPHRPVSLQGWRMSSYVQTIPLNCIAIGLADSFVERNSLCGQECALLLIRRAVLQWIGTLHESFVRLVGGIGAATPRSRWTARYLRGYELLPTVSRCE